MINDKSLLEFHRCSRLAILAVLDGLTEVQLHVKDPQREYSIAEEIGHLVAAEYYFLFDEYSFDPGFPYMNRDIGQQSSNASLCNCLNQIELRWPVLLLENPDNGALRMVIARMALHTLYHLARVADRRSRMDPDFKLPNWSEPGSREYAIEPLLMAIQSGNEIH